MREQVRCARWFALGVADEAQVDSAVRMSDAGDDHPDIRYGAFV